MTETKIGIHAAIRNVMTDVKYVHKGSENTFHKYRYASHADIIGALRPSMVKYGLVLAPNVLSCVGPDDHGNTTVNVEWTMTHILTAEQVKFCMVGVGNDRNSKGVGDKGAYKALTGSAKYAMLNLFMLETGDDPEATEDGKSVVVTVATPPKPKDTPVQEVVQFTKPNGKDEQITMESKRLWFLVDETFKTFIKDCKTEKETRRFWELNAKLIEDYKQADPIGYTGLLSAFKKYIAELKEKGNEATA